MLLRCKEKAGTDIISEQSFPSLFYTATCFDRNAKSRHFMNVCLISLNCIVFMYLIFYILSSESNFNFNFNLNLTIHQSL